MKHAHRHRDRDKHRKETEIKIEIELGRNRIYIYIYIRHRNSDRDKDRDGESNIEKMAEGERSRGTERLINKHRHKSSHMNTDNYRQECSQKKHSGIWISEEAYFMHS